MNASALETRDLTVTFGHGPRAHVALDSVSVAIGRGRTVGLVGESGSGKSTLSKALVGIVTPTSGEILVGGAPLNAMTRELRVRARRSIQLIPQDPYSSLDPRRTVAQALAEALDPVRQRVGLHRDRIAHALEEVRLPADAMARYPHEFSGGQRQRIAIARARHRARHRHRR
jgi:ABC-type dipeptide/oligopeptide/nickel transport system ATPase subunit